METKTVFKFFTIVEHKKEEEYLRAMHRSGWRFIKVWGFSFYRFEKCEPEDVIYQLDYNQEGVGNKDEYVQMFKDCGWEYLQDYVGYSYFRKPASEAGADDEIFCDDASKRQMLARVFRGRIIPLLTMLLLVLIPQFIIHFFNYHNIVISIMLGAAIVLYIAIFIIFIMQYNGYKNK